MCTLMSDFLMIKFIRHTSRTRVQNTTYSDRQTDRYNNKKAVLSQR